MEALALEFKINYPKIFIYTYTILMVNVIKINNYINIYKCHTKKSSRNEWWIRIETQWKRKN